MTRLRSAWAVLVAAAIAVLVWMLTGWLVSQAALDIMRRLVP